MCIDISAQQQQLRFFLLRYDYSALSLLYQKIQIIFEHLGSEMRTFRNTESFDRVGLTFYYCYGMHVAH